MLMDQEYLVTALKPLVMLPFNLWVYAGSFISLCATGLKFLPIHTAMCLEVWAKVEKGEVCRNE
jgi:hypothetical protein